MANVDDFGQVVGEPGGYVDKVEPRLLIRPGDLLFNRTNSLEKVGKVGIVCSTVKPTTVASYLVIVRVNRLVEAGYINYAMNAAEVLALGRTIALPSIGQANLNPSRWGNMVIALPPLAEQRRICAGLETERARVNYLRTTLNQQILLLRERRQALITAAVTGELEVA